MLNKIRKEESGFTIVELLIVIVVIGILAALVLNTFQGVQARARDTERKTDVNALATQYEVFYNDNGRYPTTTEGADATNFPGLDAEAVNDPNGVAVNAANSEYTYAPTPVGCDNDLTSNPCVAFTLTATMEEEADFVKTSLNQ